MLAVYIMLANGRRICDTAEAPPSSQLETLMKDFGQMGFGETNSFALSALLSFHNTPGREEGNGTKSQALK